MKEQPPLLERDAAADPLRQFDHWFQQALSADFVEPTAMALATVDGDGQPSLRMVLLKDHGPQGFVFYTNYASRKGEALAKNPRAALLWWWDKLQRQIRIEGTVEKLARADSERYFRTRPRGAQLSALASPQSRVVPDRAGLEDQVARLEQQYKDKTVPLPEDWGGYRLKPDCYEFWQGRRDRLHDRLLYRRDAGAWRIERIGP